MGASPLATHAVLRPQERGRAPSGVLRGGPPARAALRSLGSLAVVATVSPAAIEKATRLLIEELDRVDAAASRFRPDSEVQRLAAAGGRPAAVSALLYAMVNAACEVAELTGGAVDPTVGPALCRLGYDRDFALVAAGAGAPPQPHPPSEPGPAGTGMPIAGWWTVELDPRQQRVRVPAGLVLDLGSSGKAFAADRAARHIAEATGSGTLVSLGGDVAVAGEAPEGGWHISIDERCDTAPERAALAVAVERGGLASSSTTVRAWTRNGRNLHHVVDPWTGEPAAAVWRLVSVAAPSCLVANAASTAAIVWGLDATDRLAGLGVAARLVGADGAVTLLGGWPDEPERQR